MYRMPVEPTVTNPDSRTIGTQMNQTTAIRIDDSSIGTRKTWSSDKIDRTKADSEQGIIEAYTASYGALYLGDYDPRYLDRWGDVIYDAWKETEEGKPFLIPWSQYRTAQVISADPDAENKIIFFYNGQTWAMSSEGIVPIDISGGSGKIRMDTTAAWDSQRDFRPARAEVIIYSDRNVIDGVPYCGIKIGDGNAYLIDLPFFGDDKIDEVLDQIKQHVQDTSVHVTAREKAFWNSKLNYTTQGEILVFNRN